MFCLHFITMQQSAQPSPFQLYLTFSNMHILKPNPTSKYKVRLLINHHSAEKQLKNQPHRNKMKFYLTMDSQPLTTDDIAQVCLMERTIKDSQSMGYIEIGRGSLDMGEVSRSLRHRQRDTVDGLIYGTRAYNYDKIIAKFTYKAQGSGGNKETEGNEFMEDVGRSRAVTPKRQKSNDTIKTNEKYVAASSKMDELAKQNQAINEKMEKLSKSIATQKPKVHSKKLHKPSLKIERVPSFRIQPQPPKPTIPTYPDILWHYDSETQHLLQRNQEHTCLCIYLPNIKLYRYPVLIKDKAISLSSKVYTSPAQQQEWVLLTFYSLKHQTRTRRKWLQIITKLQYNVNNQILQNLPFYAPRDKDIHIEVTPANVHHQELHGQTRVGSSRQKLVELSNGEGEESGFVLMEVMDTVKDYRHVEQYQNVYLLQKDDFKRQKLRFKTKNQASIPKAPIDLLQSEHFSFSAKRKKTAPKRPSIWAEGRSKRMQLNYSLQRARQQADSSRYRQNRSVNLERRRLTPSPHHQLGIRRQGSIEPAQSQQYSSPSPAPRRVRYFNSQAHEKYDYYSLRITKIYFNCYQPLPSSAVVLRWSIGNTVKIKRVFLAENDIGTVEVDFGFSSVLRRDRLNIECCSLEESGMYLLGRCQVDINRLFESGKISHKAFIQNVEAMVGYLVFDYELKMQTTPPKTKGISAFSPTTDRNQYQDQVNQFMGVDENYSPKVRDRAASELQYEQTYM